MISEARQMLSGTKSSGPLERQTKKVPTDLFFWAAGASIIGSLTLKAMKRESDAIFVGHWAPTLLLLGMFSRVVNLLETR